MSLCHPSHDIGTGLCWLGVNSSTVRKYVSPPQWNSSDDDATHLSLVCDAEWWWRKPPPPRMSQVCSHSANNLKWVIICFNCFQVAINPFCMTVKFVEHVWWWLVSLFSLIERSNGDVVTAGHKRPGPLPGMNQIAKISPPWPWPGGSHILPRILFKSEEIWPQLKHDKLSPATTPENT